MATSDEKRTLRLTIEVPDIYCDDLHEHAGFLADGEPTEADYHWLVTEEWFRESVIVVLTNYPGEKCQNFEFEVTPFEGRIVGVSVDPPFTGRSGS
jgi:hypothetical protein